MTPLVAFDTETAKIGSLFSGIGGLELGLEWSGVGHTVWQVEADERCLRVLEKHWPNAKRYKDVRTVTASELERVDIMCGGFPCQDVSSAGKRAGLAGARSGLWFEYLRIVRELRPAYVVVENVASGARAWVDIVVAGLEQLGYACLPIPLAAADVGAPHERARVFIVAAHAHAQGQHAGAEHAEMGVSRAASADALGAKSWNEPGWRGRSNGNGAAVAQHVGWRSAQPDMVRVVHGVSRRLDGARARISALGNAVVPQCAEVIGHVIMELSQ